MTRGIWLHRKKWVVRGFIMKGLMTIHKRFLVHWSTRLGSSALESRRCHFLSPQKGATIDSVECEQEITHNSALGLFQVTCKRVAVGVDTHIWHTIGATGGQKPQNQDAANTRDWQPEIPFHTRPNSGLCSCSLPISCSYYRADRAWR